jgi:hypothetical protein
MDTKAGNQFSQYYLFRGKVVATTDPNDYAQMLGMEVGDTASAAVARWHLNTGLAAFSKPQYYEALPSQQIRFQGPQPDLLRAPKNLEKQSTVPFQRFHLKK